MIRRLTIWFIAFFLAFVIDVRVKAESSPENLRLRITTSVQQQPDECWDTQEGLCVVRTLKGQGARFSWSGGTLTFDESTTVVRNSAGELRIITGNIWLRGAGLTIVRSEFGEIEIPAQGEAWLNKNVDRLTVSEVSGAAHLRPRGGEMLEVPPGLSNWIGRVGLEGVAQTGVPTVPALQSFLLQWARLYSGTRKQFQDDAAAFYDTWSAAGIEAALIHKDLFVRKCASIEAERASQEETQRKVEARNRQLIQRFRRHVFDE